MKLKHKHITNEYNYTRNGEVEEYDNECEYITYEVDFDDYKDNEEVKEMYANEFAYKYNMDENKARELLDDYDIWFDDLTLVKEMAKEHNDELDEIFWDEDYL